MGRAKLAALFDELNEECVRLLVPKPDLSRRREILCLVPLDAPTELGHWSQQDLETYFETDGEHKPPAVRLTREQVITEAVQEAKQSDEVAGGTAVAELFAWYIHCCSSI